MYTEDQETIVGFIERFHGSEDVFLHGCCWWFAQILVQRFGWMASVKYEPVEGHFVTRIINRYYDVRGDVTELYRTKRMYDMTKLRIEDRRMYDRLMRQCRDFEEAGAWE